MLQTESSWQLIMSHLNPDTDYTITRLETSSIISTKILLQPQRDAQLAADGVDGRKFLSGRYISRTCLASIGGCASQVKLSTARCLVLCARLTGTKMSEWGPKTHKSVLGCSYLSGQAFSIMVKPLIPVVW
jgi:hypothetical protein